MHSMADAIVFAVYMPPHAPAPGMALLMISLYSFSSISPATFCPKASNAETIFNFLPLYFPDAVEPPYIIIDGRFKRNIEIIAPGMFLSQPTIAINAS